MQSDTLPPTVISIDCRSPTQNQQFLPFRRTLAKGVIKVGGYMRGYVCLCLWVYESFSHPESYRIRWNNVWSLRRWRSFKVTDFGTNRKLVCDFLLVINTNLPSILQRFRDIAFDRSKIATYLATALVFKHSGGVPGTISVKFLPKGHMWPRYQMAQKHCRKYQSPE